MCNVLVIEDEPDIREFMRQLFELEGHTVSTAKNGLEGLERVNALPRPCLVVLDLMMPVMDGLEFLRRLKQTPAADLPVIIVSASSTVDPPPEIPFFRKPVTVDRLLEAVTRYCG